MERANLHMVSADEIFLIQSFLLIARVSMNGSLLNLPGPILLLHPCTPHAASSLQS